MSNITDYGKPSDFCTNESNKVTQFSHPVYKQLSQINGEINRMTREQLILRLEKHNLSVQGMNEILRKRLKAFYKELKLMNVLKCKQNKCGYDYLCIIDFQTAYDSSPDYLQEIIEFTALVIDTAKKTVVEKFHKYCHPEVNSELTKSCIHLRKITWEQLNNADDFLTVLQTFTTWLNSYKNGNNSVAIVTDGTIDMHGCLAVQCNISQIPVPDFGVIWINICKSYARLYKTRKYSVSVMLQILGLKFEGCPHSGQDITHNISRIVIQMLNDGANFAVNEKVTPTKYANRTPENRVKSLYKGRKLYPPKVITTNNECCEYRYLCIIDFEATCDSNSNYLHEIIEFPAILVDADERIVVAEFHYYCKPSINKKLTEFCKSLTGITQDDVDNSDPFSVVLDRFIKWLQDYTFNNNFVVVTDGSFDMCKFLLGQCNLSNVPFPNFAKKWINIRISYSKFYNTKMQCLSFMLSNLGMKFIGRLHCGLDDARNITRIVIEMLKDGADLIVNEKIEKYNV